MKFIQLLALASALSLGCNNDSEDETDTDTDETDTDTDIQETTITLNGTGIDIATQSPVAEGLCVDIIDPTNAVTGGDSEILASTTIGADGSFSVDGITTKPPFGMFVSIADCADATEATVWASLTGLLAPSYKNLNNGDTLDVTAASVNVGLLAGIEDSLTAAGATEKAAEAGAMIAYVNDADGNPITGGTVSCDGCGTFYYFDADPSDGLFTNATTGINTATDAAAGGMVLLLAPGTSTYQAAADGLEFDGLLFGGSPGVATFAQFNAK
jgi:hypothetical protein